MKKRAQQGISMSFNWLFALLLIIIFIFAAFYAINYFLKIGSCSRVNGFYKNLQDRVDEAYVSSSTNAKIALDLPDTEFICFANLSAPITGSDYLYEQIKDFEIQDANVFLIPPENACNIPYKKIQKLDITNTTRAENPLCFQVSDGTVSLYLKKDYYDRQVIIR